MKIKLGAFPLTFFTVQCVKHQCVVGVDIRESKERTGRHIVGAQITTLECEKGGKPSDTGCSDTWEITISGTGAITIVN